MKAMKVGFWALLVTVLFLAFSSSLMALHAPGELKCMACHTIHASYEGSNAGVTRANGFDAATTDSVPPEGNPKLLLQATAMELCLVCHNGTDETLGPGVLAGANPLPGGSFTATVGNVEVGHSLKGWAVDPVTTAPGGAYETANMECISCHDEHGDPSECFTTFRNVLKDPTRDATPVTGDFASFIESDIWDGSTSVLQSDASGSENHFIYKLTGLGNNGVGAWCADCHGTGFHTTEQNVDGYWLKHPTANPLANGTDYGSYMWTYPVETVNTGPTAKTSASWTTGEGTDRVMCLSCHNAHGSAFDSAMKWNATVASPVGGGCNKCHKKSS